MRTLRAVLIVLCLACFAAAATAADAPADRMAEVNATLATLNQNLATVESLTDYGEGYASYYKKNYLFEIYEGILVIGEAYVGENRDPEGVSMTWSGRYVYRIDPALVKIGEPNYENEFFTISCPGRGKCIEYKSADAITWSRGEPKPKPQTTGGILNSVKIQAGKDKKLLKRTQVFLDHILAQLRDLNPGGD